MEKTFFMIKPDGVARGLVGTILERIERRGFTLEELKVTSLDEERLRKHYSHLVGRSFFPDTLSYMMSGKAVIGVISGTGVVSSWRQMMGATNPGDALPGTIRGDFAMAPEGSHIKNVVHGSDSVESAEREIAIWF